MSVFNQKSAARFLKLIFVWSFVLFFCLSAKSQVTTGYAKSGMKVNLDINWTADNYGTIQWQKSTDNGATWTDVSGATTASYVFTISGDALYRAKVDAQAACDPFFVVKAIKTVNFTVNASSLSSTSVDFDLTGVDFKDANIVEYGFCYNLSTLNTRNYTEMKRVQINEPLPAGNAFTLVCNGLNPGTSYYIRTYFKTADGSLIFGPNKLATTIPGLQWTSESWQINKTSISARFFINGYTTILGNPNLVFKFGTDENNLSVVNWTNEGDYKCVSSLISGLTPNTTYTAQVEANIDGDVQTITKQVRTLPDYSSAVVDQTTKPVTHTIKWDATKTLHRISPEGLQTEYPRILRVGNDTLICAYHGGTGTDYWVNIYIQKSFDNGRTWTTPIKLMDKENSVFGANYWRFTNPEMIKLRNGWIVLSFTANGRPETNENCHVMVMTSTDNGETWGDPVIVGRGRTWEPKVIQLPNDELELFVSSEAEWFGSTANLYQEILFSRSTDNGQTWTALKRASYSPERRDGMPSAVVMQGNKGILFSIEIVNDNGWGSPSLVHRALKDEWDATPWNNADTNNRWHVPMNAFGGAPYTIQLPTGEIVVSAHVNGRAVWQTSYPRITVGDNNGKNFTTPVSPLGILPAAEGAYYNSLFLKDNETVWLIITHSLYDGTTRLKGEIMYLEGKIVVKQ